jgi:hypothetical protein
MNSINYNNENYIEGNHILLNAPVYSKGCRSSRDLIKKKNIDSIKYIYARLKDNIWIITDGKSVKFDKVFFKNSFVNTIPELKTKKESTDIIKDQKGIEKAPEIIKLDDNEKFKDENNNIIEIETCGERSVDKIYFKVKDVMEGFKMENLNITIIDKNTKYIENKHYKYFNCIKLQDILKKSDTIKIKKEMFLTYHGILRVLFVSENNKTDTFIKWATETLFTVQLGNTEEKNKLVSQIKGVSYDSIQELFSINARSLPCVYLTAFNTVDKLKDIMNINNNIPNDSVVYKFGLTKSFESRKNGHKSEYKKLDKVIDMKLVYYTYVDPLYISEAETEIKNLLSDYKFEYDNHDEIVIIPNNMLKIIKTIYENIGMKYSGHTQEFNKQIQELNIKILELQNKETMYIKDIENLKLLNQKDNKIHEHELKSKDLEIDNLKKEIRILNLEMQLKNKN